ncbi:MAG: glycosyltransferase [Polyangia bacterium]
MIPVVVAAKNEESAIGACLEALLRAVEHARPLDLAIRVVCDDCTDATEAIARAHGVEVVRSSGGKIAAQRLGSDVDAPFYVFCDADVVVSPDALVALTEAMADPRVLAASVPRVPVRPLRRTALAEAAYVYNLRRGFRVEAGWISGRLFAVRRYDVPDVRGDAGDRFLSLERGLLAEDLYLSRRARHEGGPEAIVETTAGRAYFRPPETLRGLYRYYRRLRRESERTDALVPELRSAVVHRRTDRRALERAPLHEQRAFHLFLRTIRLLEVGYRVERAVRRVLRRPGSAWARVEESKRGIEACELPVE